MYAVKIRALMLNKNVAKRACGYGLLAFFAASSAAVSFLLAGLCVAYSPDALFEGYPLYAAAAAFLPPFFFGLALTAAGVLFSVFAAAFSFAFRAVFYHAEDPVRHRPARFLFFLAGVKFLYCSLTLAAKKTGTLFFLLLPPAVTAAAIRLLLRFYGLPPAVLKTGMGVVAAQTLLSAVGAWILNGRTVPVRYLLYRDPLLKVRRAIKEAEQITNGKLLYTARVRLSLAPWFFAAFLLLPLPFAVSHRGLSMAVLCAGLCGETPQNAASPGVVFYIDRQSKLQPAEG
ncbi:MAG: hypothetical protein IJT27_07770 [Clostridia bacterium]|nr:hypothetical protein [Clostridia bacterium]